MNGTVLAHHAIRGNVETEIAVDASGAGCGCAYPLDVSDAEVSRSNRILERLRDTARAFPQIRDALGALPMNLVATSGRCARGHRAWRCGLARGLGLRARPDGRARGTGAGSRTHFAIPAWTSSRARTRACRRCAPSTSARARSRSPTMAPRGCRTSRVAPRGSSRGSASNPSAAPRSTGRRCAACYVEAIEIAYDRDRWARRFLASWPEGSPAHESYWRRISEGPRFQLESALPRAA